MERFLDTLHKQLHEAQKRIEETESFSELGKLRQEFMYPHILTTRLAELEEKIDEINLIHDWITKQCVQLAINQLRALGMGDPPVPYAFVIFGSGGRKEQTTLSDQDNGIIYDLSPEVSAKDHQAIELYFSQVASFAVKGLAEAGYPPCQGNVICSNPRWRSSLTEWNSMFTEWSQNPTWEHMRYMLVVGDSRLILGDSTLFTQFQSSYHQLIIDHPDIIGRLVSNTLHYRVPLSWFGRIRPEVQGKYRGAINLKNGLYLPYINCIRLWSLANGIQATNTFDRLHQLEKNEIWSKDFCQEIAEHFRHILGLRLLALQHWEDHFYQNLSYIKLTKLPKEATSSLKKSMKLALHMQELTSKRYMVKN